MEKLNRQKILEGIRGLLLPTPLDSDEKITDISVKFLQELGIAEEDQYTFIKNLSQRWFTENDLDPNLVKLVSTIFVETDEANGPLLAERYFDLHNGLSSLPFFSMELASITLSHLRLIMHCAAIEKMSAAKITAVLISVDRRLGLLRWQDTQSILRKLRLTPHFDIQQVKDLFHLDRSMADSYFADADMHEASEMVGRIATSLRYKGDLAGFLKGLIKDDEPHQPYLQILHYQCVVSAFYDHILTNAYEFSPRGGKADWLFKQWGLSTGNPILNNAKAVDVLNSSWANGRKPNEFTAAKTLVEILSRIDQMGFVASQELCAWIRRWLVRFVELNRAEVQPVLREATLEDIALLLQQIASAPANTYGILEQRFVDVLSRFLHQPPWRGRGIGDSVNANNLSKAKLGDCDYQDATEYHIQAYEAHGGTLTAVYFEGHIRTLKRSLRKRSEELEHLAEPDEWSITITFIAYSFAMELPDPIVVEGYRIVFDFVSFAELLEKVDLSDAGFFHTFENYFIAPINSLRTPPLVRKRVLELLELPPTGR